MVHAPFSPGKQKRVAGTDFNNLTFNVNLRSIHRKASDRFTF